jgi:hypothetical protein
MVSFEGGDGWFHVSPSEGGIGNETTCVVRRWDVGSTPSFEHSVIPLPRRSRQPHDSALAEKK